MEASIRATDSELALFNAIQRGDLNTVQHLVQGNLVDVNCTDAEGQTSLQAAVKKEHTEIVTFLLSKGAFIGSALHDAINNNSLKCVAALVEYDKDKRYIDVVTTVDAYPIELLPPLALAAQNENFEITKFLMTHGYTIDKPRSNNNFQEFGRLGSYVSHLNTYRAYVSPVYISLEFLLQGQDTPPSDEKDHKDPVYRSLILKRDILNNAIVDYEFREDYLKIATKCEDFVVALLDQCRNLEEIFLLLSVPGMKKEKREKLGDGSKTSRNLDILNFAIKYKNDKVIAHRFSQVMLNSVFYSGLKNFEESNRFLSVVLVFLYWTFMPLLMLIYQVIPENSWTTKVEIPIVKYLSHVGSWMWFLVLLAIAAFQDKLPKSKITDIKVVDIVIAIWVVGLIWEEVKQCRRQGIKRYFTQWWRVVAALVCFCFMTTFVLWLTDFAILAKSKGIKSVNTSDIYTTFYRDPFRQTLRLSANSFYALGVLLTFFQISHNFQVSYSFGPLHLSMMNMVGDVIKFIIMFCLNYFAFAIGLRELYSWYVATAKSENPTAKPHDFTELYGSFRHLFWALFGLTEIKIFETEHKYDQFEIIRITGEAMFASYCISSILVALNLLIAMLTNTFHKVESDQDIKFKVARTRILMQYVHQGSGIPPPLNLIPGIKFLCSCLYKKFMSNSNPADLGMTRLTSQKRRHDESLRDQVVRALLHRYFLQRKKQDIQNSATGVVQDHNENQNVTNENWPLKVTTL